MRNIIAKLPVVTPWLLLLLFIQILFIDVQFKTDGFERQTIEILSEDPEIETGNNWSIGKGIILKLSSLNLFIKELKSEEIPQDGYPDMSFDQMSRYVFGLKLLIVGLLFLCLLCITAYFSWITQAWFRISLNKTLHWVGLIILFFSMISSLAGIASAGNVAGIFALFYFLFFVYLIFSYRGINLGKKESIQFEVLKHTSELDEEGKKPTQTVELKPWRVAYHFFIIILVGLIVGNLMYIPLFLLQKHYSYEFGILLIFLIGLLSAFYIRNYHKISQDGTIPKWKNILASLSYLQFKFLKNTVIGISATLLAVVIVTLLFSILLLNADVLKDPRFGLTEKTAEF
ncbi:LIC_10230 family protein [Leptospira sp. GIMC2001]|uniref:LIC_10230 family protein n=1 Tax=Leptospira sp. GIMC2001 TaxID=1513297 RepID=UPI00234A35A2|nr:hypothetical protein [Leptospira sp. GIMC2001]WCL48706.1 hypothetical protein O4O04_15550 [Leptospira sp. GIMC2001]